MKLLLTIILRNYPKAPTKDIEIPGRTALGVQRRFEALRKAHPLDDSGNLLPSGGNLTSSSKGVAKAIDDEDDQEPATPVVEKKRKTGAGKKGMAKKVKKEAVKPEFDNDEPIKWDMKLDI
jgi:hypothetical protein